MNRQWLYRFPPTACTTPVSAEECQRRLQTSSSRRRGVQLLLEPEDSWQEFSFDDFRRTVEFAYKLTLVWVTDDVFVVDPSLEIEHLLPQELGGTYQRTMNLNGVPVFTIEGGSSREVALAFLVNLDVRTSDCVVIQGETNQELPLTQEIMTAMVATRNLEELYLENCHLNGDQSRVLAQASMVAKLEFSKCTLSNDGQQFVEAMSLNQTPRKLYIDGKTNIDLESLGPCLRSNTSFEELSFIFWNLEDSHRLRPVFEGLAKNESIHCLDLEFTKMDTHTWMTMCESLAKNNCLETLRVGLCAGLSSYAAVSDRAQALTTMLESNTNIREFDFFEYIDQEADGHAWRALLYRSIEVPLELNRFRARVKAIAQSAHRNLEFRVVYHEEARYDNTKLYLLLHGNVDFLCGPGELVEDETLLERTRQRSMDMARSLVASSTARDRPWLEAMQNDIFNQLQKIDGEGSEAKVDK